MEVLEPRQYLSVNDGTPETLLFLQYSGPVGPTPPAAISGMLSDPNGLLVVPIVSDTTAAPDILLSSSGSLSRGPSSDPVASSAGLSGVGTTSPPSGGGRSSSTGSPSGAPYPGGAQPAGGTQHDVEDQLARTWAQWRQDWYDWSKPALDILWGIGQTAKDAVSPPGWDVVVPVIEGAPPAARAIITACQQQRVQEAIGNGDDPNGKQTDQQLEELRRLQEMTNEALNP